MSKPSGSEINDFSYHEIWESVTTGSVADRLNTREEFATYLKGKGFVSMVAEEYAEKNTGLLVTNILRECERWDALGIPRPLNVDQYGTIVTWKHPRYESISGRAQLPRNFCDVWHWVKNSRDREFLFCCAAYLVLLGCNRIYITDTSGDAGLDLMGYHERDPFRGLCFLVQAKTALNKIETESLFSDYTKFILLRHQAKWQEYQKALGIDKASDGAGMVYLFSSNLEFNPAITKAARDLPIMLRSGRQIAHSLSRYADVEKWIAVRAMVGTLDASLSRNLFGPISSALGKACPSYP